MVDDDDIHRAFLRFEVKAEFLDGIFETGAGRIAEGFGVPRKPHHVFAIEMCGVVYRKLEIGLEYPGDTAGRRAGGGDVADERYSGAHGPRLLVRFSGGNEFGSALGYDKIIDGGITALAMDRQVKTVLQ